MEKLGYSRQTQKLIYWILSDIANHFQGNEAGSTPSFIELAYTKDLMKAEFVKVYDGFDVIKNAYEYLISSINNKDNLTVDELLEDVTKALQSIAVENYGFSLKLCALTQKQANDFVKWLFETSIYYGVYLRQEIIELFAEDYHDTFIWVTLKKKICCICGRPGELQHFDRVGSSGYKSDTGMNYRVMCLCRKHHDEADSYLTRQEFVNKYHLQGIYLKPEQVEELKKVYKGHFKAYKEVKNEYEF